MLDYNNIKKYISSARLNRYEQICHNDNKKVLKLYQANLRLSQAFYPLLSLIEIILRNAMNEELSSYFNDRNWLVNQLNGFMSHGCLTYTDQRSGQKITNDYLKRSVNKILYKYRKKSTHSKIISDLNLGFWTILFEKNHFRILKGRPMNIFTKLPTGINRNSVYQKLNSIKRFRNRIYHNEPIIFSFDQQNKSIFNLQESVNIYKEIREFFAWMDLDFEGWTKKMDNIEFEIKRAESVNSKYPKNTYYLTRLILSTSHIRKKYLQN